MNRFFQILNTLLVIGLTILCIVQWQRDTTQRHTITGFVKTNGVLQVEVEEFEKKFKGAQADLDGFRSQITKLQSLTAEQEGVIRTNRNELAKVTRERDKSTNQLAGLANTIKQFQSAVSNRDDAIKKLNDGMKQMIDANKAAADKANEAVVAANSLTEKLNELVGSINRVFTAGGEKADQEKVVKALLEDLRPTVLRLFPPQTGTPAPPGNTVK